MAKSSVNLLHTGIEGEVAGLNHMIAGAGDSILLAEPLNQIGGALVLHHHTFGGAGGTGGENHIRQVFGTHVRQIGFFTIRHPFQCNELPGSAGFFLHFPRHKSDAGNPGQFFIRRQYTVMFDDDVDEMLEGELALAEHRHIDAEILENGFVIDRGIRPAGDDGDVDAPLPDG